jgi:hypothetical protein
VSALMVLVQSGLRGIENGIADFDPMFKDRTAERGRSAIWPALSQCLPTKALDDLEAVYDAAPDPSQCRRRWVRLRIVDYGGTKLDGAQGGDHTQPPTRRTAVCA